MKKSFGTLSFVLLLTAIQQGNAASSDVAAASEHAFGYSGWKALEPDSKVYCIAPANSVNPEERNLAKDHLAKFRLRAVWSDEAFTKKDPLCPQRAMTPLAAFEDLMCALRDSTVDAIWAFRGGRLSLELWPFLDAIPSEELAALPRKPIIGFSDITSLHLWFNARGFPTIHGPLALFGKDAKRGVNGETSLAPTVDILMGKTDTLTYQGLVPLNESASSMTTSISGTLVGGNLSSLDYFKSTYGKGPLPTAPNIFAIETCEDLGDATRAGSILAALGMGDFFTNTRAIVFGQFHGESATSDKYNELQARYKMVVTRFAITTSIPVFTTMLDRESLGKTFQFGHGSYNDILPFGFPTVLTMGTDPMSTTLSIVGRPTH